jgi:hypothetical protein
MFYRPYGNSTTGTVKEITFTEVTVQGGGILQIDSGGDGMKLIGTKIHVESKFLCNFNVSVKHFN